MTRAPLKIAPALLFINIVIFNLFLWAWFAGHFFPLHVDEIGTAASSFNLITGRGIRYDLYDDIFAPEGYRWRESTQDSLRPVVNTWFGIFLLIKRSPFFARLSCGVAASLALYLFFLIGNRLHSPALGILCALTAMTDPFWFVGSSLVRPEMPLMASSAAVFLLLISWEGPWQEFTIGILAGLQVGIHPNAIPLHMGIWVAYWQLKNPTSAGRSFIRYTLGAISGVILLFGCLNMDRLWQAFSWFLMPLFYPPITRWPWHPLEWLQSLSSVLISGQTYYLSRDLVPRWPLAVQMYWSGVALCLAYGIWLYRLAPDTRRYLRALGGALLVTFLGMALLIGHLDAVYALNLKTVLTLLLGFILFGAWRRTDIVSRCAGILSACLLTSSLLVFIYSAATTPQRYKNFEQLAKECQSTLQIVPHHRVIGPLWLWYVLPLHTFRDAGGLVISRYYTGGQSDIARWVAPWSPDVFVVDWGFRRTYMKDPNIGEQDRLRQLLGRPVRHIGTIEGGYSYGSVFSVYQIQ